LVYYSSLASINVKSPLSSSVHISKPCSLNTSLSLDNLPFKDIVVSAISKWPSKNPEEYENENDRKRKIGLTIGARKGDVIEYYESDNKEGYSLSPQEISIRKYKTMIWKAVMDILEIAGYDIAIYPADRYFYYYKMMN
jgi:hypothetical protein